MEQQPITNLPKYNCIRCGHAWVPRLEVYPTVCPKCHSPYWDKVRTQINCNNGGEQQ